MTTKAQAITTLKEQYPTIQIGSDAIGYTELSPTEYETQISEWADIQLADEAKAAADKAAADKAEADKAVATAKLAALGLTTDDLKALGLGTK